MFTRFLVTGLPLVILVRHGGVCSTGTCLCCVQTPLNLQQQQPKLMVSLLYLSPLFVLFHHLGDRLHSDVFKLENLLIL